MIFPSKPDMILTIFQTICLSLITSQCRAIPGFNPRSVFTWTEYLDWIRSPTPLNVYPKIFTKLGTRNVKRGAASHSTSWGKRSGDLDNILPPESAYNHYTTRLPMEAYFGGGDFLKRSSSTGIKKLLFKVKPSQRSIMRPLRLKKMKKQMKTTTGKQSGSDDKLTPVTSNQEIDDKKDTENPNDELSTETKRVWLPELDYPDTFSDQYDTDEIHDDDDDDDTLDEDLDGVTMKSLLNDDYENQYFNVLGNLHRSPNHSWEMNPNERKFVTFVVKQYIQKLKQRRKHNIIKRRLGIVQNSSNLPTHEECYFLDRISQYVCHYLLTKAKAKLNQMQTCEKGCFRVGSKREVGSGVGISGGFDSLVPALNEVAGKKIQKNICQNLGYILSPTGCFL